MADEKEYKTLGRLTRTSIEKFIAKAMQDKQVPPEVAKEFTDLTLDDADRVHAAETPEERAKEVMIYATNVAIGVKEYVNATRDQTPLGYPHKVCTCLCPQI